MTQNRNGYIAVDEAEARRTKQESMALFDSLSPEVRAIIRDAHHNVSIKPGKEHLFKRGQGLKRTLLAIAKESALKTYGPNYPMGTVK